MNLLQRLLCQHFLLLWIGHGFKISTDFRYYRVFLAETVLVRWTHSHFRLVVSVEGIELSLLLGFGGSRLLRALIVLLFLSLVPSFSPLRLFVSMHY